MLQCCMRSGARIAVDTKQNAELYGEEATVASILDIKKTKRPAPFDRLVKVRHFLGVHVYQTC